MHSFHKRQASHKVTKYQRPIKGSEQIKLYSTTPASSNGQTARRSQISIEDIQRHRILPHTVREKRLIRSIRIHDHDLAVRLEGVVVDSAFVAEAVHAAVVHDATVGGPNCVCVVGAAGCELGEALGGS